MSYIGNQPTYAAFVTDQFSGNGGTTFTMSVAPANTASVLVAVSGVLQDPSTYSVVGTTLTFSQAPPVATANISVRYMGIPASGVTNTAYRTVTEFTATNAQTIFSVPSYTVGFINVYLNGVRLGAADFTASNGTTVVLTAGAPTGALVTTESFYVSSVLNAIPATAGAVNSTYITDGAVVTSKVADAALTQAKLAANVAGNGPAFSAYASANQAISATIYTKVQFNTEEFDTNSNFNNTGSAVGGIPPYAFMPTVAGYYQVNIGIDYSPSSNCSSTFANIFKNGSAFKRGNQILTSNGSNWAGLSALIYMNGTTDYLEGYAWGNTAPTIGGSQTQTFFQASLVRAA